jgi:hypothetical protein
MAQMLFENETGTRLQLWLGELPSSAFVPNDTKFESFSAKAELAIEGTRFVAIEVFRSFGASFHYALLGGEFHSSETASLELAVPLDTLSLERPFTPNLSRALDTVHVGGEAEFVSGIRNAIQQIESIKLPSGNLKLSCMAHGAIGSVPTIFGSAMRGLLRVLASNQMPSTFEEAMELLA